MIYSNRNLFFVSALLGLVSACSSGNGNQGPTGAAGGRQRRLERRRGGRERRWHQRRGWR